MSRLITARAMFPYAGPTLPLPPSRDPFAGKLRAFHQHFCCPQLEPDEPLPASAVLPDYLRRADLLLAVLARAEHWRLWTECSHVYGRSYHAEAWDEALAGCAGRAPTEPVGAVAPTIERAILECLLLAGKVSEV